MTAAPVLNTSSISTFREMTHPAWRTVNLLTLRVALFFNSKPPLKAYDSPLQTLQERSARAESGPTCSAMLIGCCASGACCATDC